MKASANPQISILIVNWKSAPFVRKCVQTIAAHAAELNPEIVVVDGGSFDECGEMLKNEFPLVKFVQSDENVGFGGANNLGFKATTGDTILLLNPDTEVRPNAIQELSKALSSLPKAGAVGAKLLNSDGSLQTSCVMSYPTVLNQLLDSEFLRDRSKNSKLWGVASLYNGSKSPTKVEAISGACIMLPRAVYERVGGFDPRYFMYGEDVDLCFKIHQAGFNLYYVPKAEIVHHGGGSSSTARSSFSTVMMRHSVRLFLSLRRGPLSAALFSFCISIAAIVRLALCSLSLMAKGKLPKTTLAPIQKWVAILRWSLGLEKWSKTMGMQRSGNRT